MTKPEIFPVRAGKGRMDCINGNAGNCRSCGAATWWVTTPNGKALCIDSKPDESGLYIAHFATCPHAKEWRKGARRG